MRKKIRQQENSSFSEKVSDRLAKIIQALGTDMKSFSLKIGKSHVWAREVIAGKGALKAKDVVAMNEVSSINPNYILFGEEPMFLEKESGNFKGENL